MDAGCGEIRKMMVDQLNGRTSADAEEAIRLHVAECEACQAYQDELLGDDRLLSEWAGREESGMTAGIERVIGLLDAVWEQPVLDTRRAGRGRLRLQGAIAAGLLIGVGLAAGLAGSRALSGPHGQAAAGALSPEARAAVIEEVLARVRGEIEQSGTVVRQELRTEVAQQIEKVAADLDTVLDRDRQWLASTLNDMEQRHRTDRASVHGDLAKLARMTETEFARTRQYMVRGPYGGGEVRPREGGERSSSRGQL